MDSRDLERIARGRVRVDVLGGDVVGCEEDRDGQEKDHEAEGPVHDRGLLRGGARHEGRKILLVPDAGA